MRKERSGRHILNPQEKKNAEFLHIIKVMLFLYLIYFLISMILPPMFQKRTSSASNTSALQTGSERVMCIDDNEAALIWRLRMIDNAENEIILATFDLRNDHSGGDVIAALQEAADRGVHICILVDGISGCLHLRHDAQFRALAAMPNVEAKFYNPINLITPWRINYRMHDKYLIVDDTAYLLGGRNVYDLFLGEYVDSYNIDRDILVYEASPGENSSLSQLQAYFTQIWGLEYNQAVNVRTTKSVEETQATLRHHAAVLRKQYAEAYAPFNWEAETTPANRIDLLSNPAEPENKAPQVWTQLCCLMRDGTDIQIQTPYIICNSAMYADLTMLCSSGANIQIMTNAVENGANPFGCTDYLNQKSAILNTGVSVAEWLGGQSLHTKTVLIDDSICVVGSYNMDMRSTYLDTELMLVIDCPDLNKELRAGFAAMAEQSRLVAQDGSELLGAACAQVELSFVKNCLYQILRILLAPIRYLL